MSQYAIQLVFTGKTIDFNDNDNDDADEGWQPDLPKLLNGVGFAIKEGYLDIDADVADCIIQYALFGRTVYS